MRSLDVHRRALAAWREISEDERKLWNEYAATVLSHRPPFTRDHHITGHNLFVSAYHGFYTLGEEHTPTPARFREFPPFVMEYEGASTTESGILLQFRLHSSTTFSSDDYAVLGKFQLTEPGGGCHPGKMRNCMASDMVWNADGSWTVTFRIDDPSSFGPPKMNTIGYHFSEMNTFCCHLRYVLIDRRTGYRSQTQRLSVNISI